VGAPKMPKAPPPGSAVPNILDPMVMFARQRQQQKLMQSAGRQSTILASGIQPTNKLGGMALSGSA